jgi:hypothetical protein
MVQCETRVRDDRAPELDPQLYEQIFKVGFVDDYFMGLLAFRRGLDGAFIESLK